MAEIIININTATQIVYGPLPLLLLTGLQCRYDMCIIHMFVQIKSNSLWINLLPKSKIKPRIINATLFVWWIYNFQTLFSRPSSQLIHLHTVASCAYVEYTVVSGNQNVCEAFPRISVHCTYSYWAAICNPFFCLFIPKQVINFLRECPPVSSPDILLLLNKRKNQFGLQDYTDTTWLYSLYSIAKPKLKTIS